MAPKNCLVFLFGLLLTLSQAVPALADNWLATIHENGAPASLIGVDKKQGIFNYFEKKSPLKVRYSYPCVTGQLKGDKKEINDLRTPEGVYFVEYKIANGLDFKEYGGIAYTLNYPNPVDRLRGKTGHGIWIHSKGFELLPTRGCVAIDLKNIAEVGPLLKPGVPVVVAEELKGIVNDTDIPAHLTSLMTEWSNAWAARSPKLFDFYDQEAYSLGTENFTAFRQNKERLFKILSFIKIYNRQIHALEGPGYWVTWSEQLYTASNLSTEGVRRLYWQKNPAGEFRIVGMEWIPRDVGMQADFLKGRLVASATPVSAADAAMEKPVPPKLDMPEKEDTALQIAGGAVDSGLASRLAAFAEKLVSISDPLIPKPRMQVDRPDEIKWGTGRKLTEQGTTTPTTQEQQQVPEAIAKPNEAKPDIIKTISAEALTDAVNAWVKDLTNKNLDILDYYDRKNFNRMPAALNIPKVYSLNNIIQAYKRDFNLPWQIVFTRKPQLEIGKDIARTEIDMLIVNPQGMQQGVQNLWWHMNEAGELQIVGAVFRPQALGLEANYLEKASAEIQPMLENWRKAWEESRLDDYIAHYTAKAWQQGRVGEKNISRQKAELWNRVKPTLVQLSGIRYTVDPAGIRVDMNQTYADSAGRTDKGIKTLLLHFDGHNWKIQREDWAKL